MALRVRSSVDPFSCSDDDPPRRALTLSPFRVSSVPLCRSDMDPSRSRPSMSVLESFVHSPWSYVHDDTFSRASPPTRVLTDLVSCVPRPRLSFALSVTTSRGVTVSRKILLGRRVPTCRYRLLLFDLLASLRRVWRPRTVPVEQEVHRQLGPRKCRRLWIFKEVVRSA